MTGRVSRDEFDRCVTSLNLSGANADEFEAPEHEGMINYRAFLAQQDGNEQFVDRVVRKLCTNIRTNLAASGGDVRAALALFEPLAVNGKLTYDKFKDGLQAMRFELADGETRAVLERFDTTGDGTVSFEEFLEHILRGDPLARKDEAGAVAESGQAPGAQFDSQQIAIMRRVLYVAQRRGIELRALFEEQDAHGQHGFVTPQAFADALHAADSTTPAVAVNELISALDAESMGRVEYIWVLHSGERNAGGSRARFEEQLRAMVREQELLQKSLRVPFTHFDRKRKGRFDSKAWRRAVADLALEVSTADLEDTFARMNLSGSGRVTFNEFAVFVRDPEFAQAMERKVRKLIMSLVVLESWDRDIGDMNRALRSCLDGEDEKVDRHSLKLGLRKLGLDLPREDLVRLIARYDVHGNGRASYLEISQFLERCTKLARQAATISSELRSRLGDRVRADPSFSLREHFSGLPPGGVTEKSAFTRRLAEAGLGLEERDIHRLADCFEFGPASQTPAMVDVEEFLQFLLSAPQAPDHGGVRDEEAARTGLRQKRKPTSPKASDGGVDANVLDATLQDLQRIVHLAKEQGTDYRRSFEHFDKDYSGEITVAQLHEGLAQLGLRVSKDEAKELIRRFAGRRKNTINYRHFLRALVPGDQVFVEEVAEKLREMIRQRMTHHGGGKGAARRVFKHFEQDSRGQITRDAFRKGLHALKLDLTDSEMRMLLDKFDLDGNGRISFEEFVAFQGGADASAGREARMSNLRKVDAEADDIGYQLKSLIRKAHREGVDYRQSFEHFDPHYAGSIDVGDFERGLRRLGFDVRPEHVRALQDKFAGRDGRIRYRDFLRAVAPAEEATAEQIAEKFRRMLARVGNLRKAFKHFDRNRAGNITRKGFKHGLESLNFDLSDSELRVLMDIFDADGDGEISFDEFVNFASNLSDSSANPARDGGLQVGAGDAQVGPGEAITIGLHKLKLAKLGSSSSSLERVFVQFNLPELEHHRSPALAIGDARKRQSIKLDFSKKMVVRRGSKERKQLAAALRSNKCRLNVELVGVKSSGRTKVLARAALDLQDALEDMEELEDEELSMYDEDDQLVARLSLSVTALDVLQALRR